MKLLFKCVLLASVFSVQFSSAQTKNPPHIHHEDSELKNLNYFVGSWTLTAKVGQSVASQAGEYRQGQRVEWMEGQHFLISHTETKGALGDTVGLAITGYDPGQKKFVYHSFHSTGSVEHGTGEFDGKKWIWLSEPPKTEVRLQRRITLVEVSPDEYSFQLEIAPDGKNWTTVMRGNAIKQH